MLGPASVEEPPGAPVLGPGPVELLRVPLRIVAANVGTAAAGPFDVAVGGGYAALVAAGTLDAVEPRVDGLGPGESVTIEVDAVYPIPPPGPDELVAVVDPCAGREPLPCEVREADEDNNTAGPRSVDFPPIAVITEPGSRAELTFEGPGRLGVTLDASGSRDPDGGELTYLWTVAQDAGRPQRISVEPTDSVVFDVGLRCGVPTVLTFVLTVEDPTGLVDRASVAVPYELVCPVE